MGGSSGFSGMFAFDTSVVAIAIGRRGRYEPYDPTRALWRRVLQEAGVRRRGLWSAHTKRDVRFGWWIVEIASEDKPERCA